MSQSDVARLIQHIEQEYHASKRGLEGLASGSARHDFIQKRAENIGQCHEHLTELIGPEEAIALIANTIWMQDEQGVTLYHAQAP